MSSSNRDLRLNLIRLAGTADVQRKKWETELEEFKKIIAHSRASIYQKISKSFRAAK